MVIYCGSNKFELPFDTDADDTLDSELDTVEKTSAEANNIMKYINKVLIGCCVVAGIGALWFFVYYLIVIRIM